MASPPTGGPPDEEVVDLLIEADGPTEVTHHVQPTVDSHKPVTTEYPDYNSEETRVITCRIANDLYPKDRRFDTREDAKAWVEETYGRVVGAQYVPGRAFFRVVKRK